MRIVINGEVREVSPGLTVAALLARLGIRGPSVAVEVNQEVVPRAQHAERPVREGDRIEVVTAVGGG